VKRIVAVLGTAAAVAILAVLLAPDARAIGGCDGPGDCSIPGVTITDVSPDGGTTGAPPSTNVTVVMDEAMACSLDNRNFYLKKLGARRRVQATVTSGQMTSTLDPLNDLKMGARYKATIALTRVSGPGWYFKSSACQAQFGSISDPSATFNSESGKITWTFQTASS